MSRVRTRVIGGESITTSMVGQTRFIGDPEPVDKVAETTYISDSETQITTDTVTPEFEKLRNQGAIINNYFLSENTKETPAQPTAYHRGYRYGTEEDWTGAWWTGNWPLKNDDHLGAYLDPFIANPSIASAITEMTQSALTTAHANASSGEVEGLVTLAESEKTIASLRDIMGRVYRILKAAKKLDIKKLKREIKPKELADRYMELRYALRPLIFDANDIIAAVEASRSYENSRQTYRGFESDSWSLSDTIPLQNYFDASGVVSRETKISVNVRAGVLADVQTSGGSIWGLDQMAETAWELVPFSFVADWFVNIGEKIAAFSPSAGVRELASWSTVITTLEQTNRLDSIESTKDSGVYYLENSLSHSGEKTRTKKIVERTPNPNLTVWPEVKFKLDGYKLLDLAIILSKFKK